MNKAILILALVLFCGCGGDPDITRSGGELYEELFTADCEDLAVCGGLGGFTIEQCIDLKVNEACAADLQVCREEYTLARTEWNACIDAMYERDCASVNAGLLPSECLTIDELI
jgi:hypothetical protein